MNWITNYPLRLTIPIFLLVAGIAISSYSTLSNWRAAETAEEETAMTNVTHDMSELQSTVTSFINAGDDEAIRFAIANKASIPNTDFVLLVDEHDVVLQATRLELIGLPAAQVFSDIDLKTARNAKETLSGKAMLSKQRDFIAAYYPVMIGARGHELRPSRIGLLLMKYDLTYPKAASRYAVQNQAWWSVALYNCLFLSLGIVLHYTMTKRVRRLVTAASGFAAGDISSRSGLEGKDEFAQLSHALDNMIETIVKEQTERQAMEEEVRKAQLRFELILDSIEALVYVADLTTYEILFINRYGREIWGNSVGCLCWKTFQTDETGPCSFCTNSKLLLPNGEPGPLVVGEHQDRVNQRWYEHRDQAIRWADNRLVHIQMATDITDRALAEQSLHRLNRELRAISNCNQSMIRAENEQTLLYDICRIICDEAGYRMAWVGYAENDEAKAIRPAAWAGMEDGYLDEAMVTWSDTERGRGPGGRAIRSGKSACIQDFMTDPQAAPWRDGALRRGYRSCVSLPLKDEFEKTFGVLTIYSTEPNAFTDDEVRLMEELAGDLAFGITVLRARNERKKLEAQFMQAQKMESVGRLAGGVAHDFNNMLSVILGYTELAMGEVSRGSPLHDKLIAIQNAGNRSADIVRQMLAFARKQTIQPKILSLNLMIEDMLKMLRRLMGENIDIVWKPKSGLWHVKMDPAQIDQIMANLCVNARDAIYDVGKVVIETENVILDRTYCASYAGFEPGEYVLLAVSDSGCGMNEETRERLFEPFFTTKVVGKGTGLGLSTVYGIVKQNNGFINVYSELNCGTTFRIYIPRQEEAAIEKTAEESVELQGGDETVLLVEDEAEIMKMTKGMLHKLGYTVQAFSVPREAVHFEGEYPGRIDLLITDVIMPEMNGRELFARLQEKRAGLKCLFMSGYSADVIVQHGALEEGVQFIQKPFSMKDLAAKVRTVLEAVK